MFFEIVGHALLCAAYLTHLLGAYVHHQVYSVVAVCGAAFGVIGHLILLVWLWRHRRK